MSVNTPHLKNRRVRIFAGPNGSGKSSVFEMIANTFDVGVYVNADEIEKSFISGKGIELEQFGISSFSMDKLDSFLENHSLRIKADERGFSTSFKLGSKGLIQAEGNVNSYQAALLADFIRTQLILQGTKFTFETVMSDPSKVDFMNFSRENGFKIYLYYVCTVSPVINVARVKQRVETGGHPVPEDLIVSRYTRSLENLQGAIENSYRAFLWDNSGKEAQLALEVFEGKTIVSHSKQVPNWVQEYCLNKL